MKQLIQNIKSGETILEEVPVPQVKPGTVLIQTTRSLVSLGTERMLVEFGKANYFQKAKQQPDKVKEVLNKIKTDGLKPTVDAVFNKLGQPLPLGYCNVGKVVAVGKGVEEFTVGDRVASNGNHAEYVCVAKNLVAKIPDNVSDEEATFTVIGSIGLQGIRLINPTLGETVVVVGLGLIGLISAQLLIANGCHVIGFDFDQAKVDLARSFGVDAHNPGSGVNQVKYVLDATQGIGCDAVLITASNSSNEIISQSAQMSRKRGRIVLVGVVGLNLSRDEFYQKELTFQVSCSYGPGRYDEDYEAKGVDYPIGFVRWTEKRNFEAILQTISRKRIDVLPLITDRIPLAKYKAIYEDMGNKNHIASLLVYPEQEDVLIRKTVLENRNFSNHKGVMAIIGAGNFTGATMLPALNKIKADIKYISSSGGLSGKTLAKKFNIANTTTDNDVIFEDTDVDVVLITTRHDQHADLVMRGLKQNKHVFVEKPLALNESELKDIIIAYKNSAKTLTVGFNRRFAPLAQKMKFLLGVNPTPVNIIATMNAGFIPTNVWVHDMEVGGGRIIGEACHYIDLCCYLSGSRVKAVCMNSLGENPEENTDNASILLKMENGSNAVINYFANGSKAYSKERIEVYNQERTLIMDNWRKLKGYGFKGFKSAKSGQDKGHAEQFRLLKESVKSGGKPIVPIEDIVNVTQASFAAIESLKRGVWVDVE